MNYQEIVDAALAYADRDDSHITDMIGSFLPVVEARVNRVLQVSKMTVRATVPTIEGQEYYGLPEDFAGIRDIEVRTDATSTDRETLLYISPEQMNNHASNSGTKIFYTIAAQQIHIYPPQTDRLMEIIYYQQLPPLTSSNTENWLSKINPDVYIFGMLVEISSFTKDVEAAQMWQARFSASVDGIINEDEQTRWSGPSLQVRIG